MWSLLSNLFNRDVKAEPAKQRIDNLSLYHFSACPFCRAVRKQIDLLGIDIAQRNIYSNEQYLAELTREGGKKTVPCLRIEHENGDIQWMYESMDIIAYLRKRFD